jgi:hypothetical protein
MESYSAKLIIKYAGIAPIIEENFKVLIKNENN